MAQRDQRQSLLNPEAKGALSVTFHYVVSYGLNLALRRHVPAFSVCPSDQLIALLHLLILQHPHISQSCSQVPCVCAALFFFFFLCLMSQLICCLGHIILLLKNKNKRKSSQYKSHVPCIMYMCCSNPAVSLFFNSEKIVKATSSIN